MNVFGLARTVIGVATFALAGQVLVAATGHAWVPWSPAPGGSAARQHAQQHPGPPPAVPHHASHAECPPDEPDDRPAAPAGGFGQTLTVVVPATSILETDEHGRLVAATSNTGCPPRSTDELWLPVDDGSLEPAEATVLRGVHWYVDPADSGRYVRHPPHP